MSSLIWTRLNKEARANPYEYDAQDQFVREAETLLNSIHSLFHDDSKRFHRDDVSKEKAVWMLTVDALDSLRDCLQFLKVKKHRIANRLFRDIIETLDLAAYINSQTDDAKRDLQKWYDNKIIPHSRYRDYLKKYANEDEHHYKTALYTQLKNQIWVGPR